jgi:hypothetical protein
LLAVNRVRYIRKYHSSAYAKVFHGAVILSELLRCWKPDRRGVLRTVLDEGSWTDLPGASKDSIVGYFPRGSVIMPAHNEAGVIARALSPLAPLAASRLVEVIVVCNGCTDNTAEIARRFDGVTVLESTAASKPSAMNAGDAAASEWPRLYLDADVEITTGALRELFLALAPGGLLAGRPNARYDLAGAHPLIRAQYRARTRLPSNATSLYSAGAFALSKEGHLRLEEFPEVLADDLYVDRLFSAAEKAVLDVEPVIVRPPRTLKDHLAVMRRICRANAQVNRMEGQRSSTARTVSELIRSVRGPLSAVDALIYAGFAIAGRKGARVQRPGWERDDSSRRSSADEPRR